MKKILSILALTIGISLTASADEGMWLLPLLQKFNSEAMRNLGCRLTADDIYSINHSSLKDAIVQFGGGCTGEIISGEGLLVTNHHCGYSSIQRLSTPEHNYLEDGYWALNREMELPVPGLSVTFLEGMQDVTAAFKNCKTDEEIDAKREELIKKAGADNPHCRAVITGFYNENVYYLILYKVYRDVRFVAAPPASMGKFGGETDNWMWPRHTCDFSMFRVYANPENNEPAEYDPANVPLKPVRSLKVSLKGVQTGDYAMVMGYPGRTQRFQTAEQLQNMVDVNRIRIDARTVRQNVMWEEMEKDPAVRLQYANKYAGSANGWKKWQGEELAFANLKIIEREKAKEAEFTKWVDARKKRQEAYGGSIEQIAEAVQGSAHGMEVLTLLTETLANIERLDPRSAGDKDYNPAVDRKIAKALIGHYLARVAPADRIDVSDSEEYLDKLYSDTTEASALRDKIMGKLMAVIPDVRGGQGQIAEGSKRFTAGLLEWEKGKPSYPDANFTMRLTYGSVLPYSPKDGVSYWYYTTTNGLLEKEDPTNYEFRLPARVKELAQAKDFGQYADKDGSLHTCFLTNNDITGGNSGSPVLDADGNLIGLAFDGNWESMSSDVMFEPDLQRCICVDIRYVLWMVDKFGGATNLINELCFA
ncbi:MAG: S46 family peptidase, partial [Bacteroidales bacterium]|nr:S46 family peptidase [Bacteroidales bacterium]